MLHVGCRYDKQWMKLAGYINEIVIAKDKTYLAVMEVQ
jgi:hypothetical protein